MIVRKCAFQAVDSLRFPSVCQIQHTAHTGKLFIVRSADRLFKKLLLPVWVRLRKREAQFGTACCCDLGKQSIKHLMSQNAAISNIEVTDGNIKSFERTASKYGLDFALKKDVSVEPPSYLVFFKGRDVDVMTAAFKEFSAKTVKQKEQPSIRHKLDQEKAQSKAQHKEKVKVKTKDRGVEL